MCDKQRSPGQLTVAEMADEAGYSENDECSVDALIDYKNSLEDRLVEMIDLSRASADMNTSDGLGADETDAAAYVEAAMRGRLDTLRDLLRIASGDPQALDPEYGFNNDEILRLGLAYGIPGPIPDSQLEEEADTALNEMPLAVETTTLFEIVLGTGRPDDRLIVECDRTQILTSSSGGHPKSLALPDDWEYEIRRILYRYSPSSLEEGRRWLCERGEREQAEMASAAEVSEMLRDVGAEIVLSGKDKEVAEQFARRVVPELVE